MKDKTCSVIIPTYNNASVLPVTLKALLSQKIPVSWKVDLIISDDGSIDASKKIAIHYCNQSTWRYKVIEQGHVGSAGARNKAASLAEGNILFFLGADIVLQPNALASHLDFHSQYQSDACVGLGFVIWDPRIHPTPLMEWMTHSGPQNNFDSLLGKTKVDAKNNFYGSNISIKKNVFNKEKFNTAFFSYGWEDLELGCRLDKTVSLYPLVRAVGMHHHFYSLSDILGRQEKVGQGLLSYQRLHPNKELIANNSLLKRIYRKTFIILGGLSFLRGLMILFGSSKTLPWLFQRLTAGYFWKGLYKAKK